MPRTSLKSRWDRGRNWFVARLRVGTPHAVALLALLAFAVAAAGAVLIRTLHVAKSGREVPGWEALWESMIRTLDPGQLDLGQLSGGDAGSGTPWEFALVAFGLTITGLLLISSLISLINNIVERSIERAGRGRATVRVSQKRDGRPYIVILGWSDIAPRLLRELAASGEDSQAPDVLVMAPTDVSEMEQRVVELREECKGEVKIKRHWPEFRTGSPFERRDLTDRAAVAMASTVIVLSGDTMDSPPAGDHMSPAAADVVRTVFAVASSVEESRHSDGLERVVTVVAEVPESGTGDLDLAGMLTHRFGSAEKYVDVIAVDSATVQARIAAQVARRPGLAGVYTDLLDFTGHEFRIATCPKPMTFGDAVQDSVDASVVGICRAAQGGGVDLWPDWSEELAAGDRLVVVCDGPQPPTMQRAPGSVRLADGARPNRPSESGYSDGDVTVIGWNSKGQQFVESLDRYLSPTSRICVVSADERSFGLRRRFGAPGFEPVAQIVPPGGVQRWLDTANAQRTVQHAVLLADESVPAPVADAETLLAIQALHPAGHAGNPTTIVAELRHRSSRHLPAHHVGFDVIVGDALVALLLAQYAVNHEVHHVIGALIGSDGNEIDLVPSPELAADATFGDLVAACGLDGQIAIGLRTKSPHEGRHPRLHLNPPKTTLLGEMQLEDVVVLTRPPAARTSSMPGSCPREVRALRFERCPTREGGSRWVICCASRRRSRTFWQGSFSRSSPPRVGTRSATSPPACSSTSPRTPMTPTRRYSSTSWHHWYSTFHRRPNCSSTSRRTRTRTSSDTCTRPASTTAP